MTSHPTAAGSEDTLGVLLRFRKISSIEKGDRVFDGGEVEGKGLRSALKKEEDQLEEGRKPSFSIHRGENRADQKGRAGGLMPERKV